MTFTIAGKCWDLDCLRDRFWLWRAQRKNNRGRHSRRAFDREMDRLSGEISTRAWPEPAQKAPEPEWTVEAILRSARPHLYAADREYWRDQWAWMALWMADWRAVSAAHRIECGLAA